MPQLSVGGTEPAAGAHDDVDQAGILDRPYVVTRSGHRQVGVPIVVEVTAGEAAAESISGLRGSLDRRLVLVVEVVIGDLGAVLRPVYHVDRAGRVGLLDVLAG